MVSAGGRVFYVSNEVESSIDLYDSYADAEPDMLGNEGHGYEGTIGVLQDLLVGDGRRFALRQRLLDERCKPAGRSGWLIGGNGLLEPAWFSRLGWYFGTPIESRKSNAKVAQINILDSPRQGQYLVFDATTTCSVRMFPHIGKFDRYNAPGDKGYRIFADETTSGKNRWNVFLPVRVEAMLACADKTLFLAGSPDIADPSDPWSAIDGRRGGRLVALAADTGRKLAELRLKSPPVFDGMSAADGNLFLCLQNGTVVCYHGR